MKRSDINLEIFIKNEPDSETCDPSNNDNQTSEPQRKMIKTEEASSIVEVNYLDDSTYKDIDLTLNE